MRVLFRFFRGIIIYTVFLAAFLFLVLWLSSQFIWYETTPFYGLLHWLNVRKEIFAILLLLGGYVAIFLYYWIQTFRYLEEVIQATEDIYTLDAHTVSLAPELKEVENHLNRLKIESENNARAAKEAEQRKNDLVVYLAHDLKTPLTSVIGYLTLLKEEPQISPQLRDKYLSISLDRAERLEDLINEFFEITRFNLTQLSLDLSTVNLSRMLEQIVFEFEPMFKEHQLTAKLQAPKDLKLRCDANKMQRVFDNLLRNAVNYSFPESVIEITVVHSGENVVIRFLNHGNTIPPEKLERIFEQFYRLDTARATRSGGAGLGLAIAKEIVELHKGTIKAESYDDRILFTVTLPIL